MTWNANQPYKPESMKIVWEVAEYLFGRGVDVGAGSFKILPSAIAVDNGIDNQLFGIPFKPDLYVPSADAMDVFADDSMNYVYSSHLLEHMEDPLKALKEFWRILRKDGNLILYLPHEDLYPKIGEPGANVDHKHNLNETKIIDWMKQVGGWDLFRCERRDQDDEYSFLMCFKKLDGKKRLMSYQNPKPEKTACVVRYGAFGDLIQTSSIIAGLKKQGFHVTVFASPPGSDVILHDPHIDRLVLFGKDQVPNADLGNFWKWQSKKFDRFVNLSESVEGSLLAMNGRIQYEWTPAARHMMMNLNYMEFSHSIAGVPHDLQVKFYPLPEEKVWARKQREAMKYDVVLMWSLAGSAVHKTWAGLDNVIASILVQFPNVAIMLVGGFEAKILEQGWENEPRVYSTCGKFTIRQTFAMLNEVDLVIGPETGVLNAACCMDMPKVLFLSHSTHENLSRDWNNVIPLASPNTVCKGRGNNEAPACHMLHYGFDHCTRHEESGTAQCQVDIGIEQVWTAVSEQLEKICRDKLRAA